MNDFVFKDTRATTHYVEPPSNKERFALAIGISLAIHLSVIILMSKEFVFQPQAKKVFNISITPEIIKNLKRNQIVSPSETQNKIVPKETNQLSDQNNSVLEESIRRGDSPDAGAQVSNSKEALSQPQEATKKSNPEQAKVTRQDPTDPFIGKETYDPLTEEQQQTEDNLAKALAGSSTIGRSGSPDLLPQVRDGEITLLNTKASKYAVFVRRVALQVFNELKRQAWRGLSYQDVRQILSSATVEAILDKNGKLISAKLISESKSKKFDDILLVSVKNNASDPHPPASALVNNQYQFIFQTSLTASMAPGAGRRGVNERRWLIMRVGLR